MAVIRKIQLDYDGDWCLYIDDHCPVSMAFSEQVKGS